MVGDWGSTVVVQNSSKGHSLKKEFSISKELEELA